jgi:hypothetical protein
MHPTLMAEKCSRPNTWRCFTSCRSPKRAARLSASTLAPCSWKWRGLAGIYGTTARQAGWYFVGV